MATVWLRRSLAFQTSMLDGVGRNRSASFFTIAMDAYRLELEKHHDWMLKATFKVGPNAMRAEHDAPLIACSSALPHTYDR